jgi:hypothetical protein
VVRQAGNKRYYIRASVGSASVLTFYTGDGVWESFLVSRQLRREYPKASYRGLPGSAIRKWDYIHSISGFDQFDHLVVFGNRLGWGRRAFPVPRHKHGRFSATFLSRRITVKAFSNRRDTTRLSNRRPSRR